MIFLSARGEVADKVSGLELGAIDYITKPIQGEEVLARVAAHLSRQHLERELRAEPRSARSGAGRRGAHAAAAAAAGDAGASRRSASAAYYQTSRHAGGDYYDVLPLGDDRFGILVADVSGHGAPAAIVMAMIRAVVHTYPGRRRRSAGGAALHQPAFPVPVGHVDVCDGGLRGRSMPARGTLRLASAGHPLPLNAHRGDGRHDRVASTRRCACCGMS